MTTEVTAQLQPPGAGYHVYRCWVVQDGHSTTEDRIYNALWSLKLKQLNPKIRQYVYIRLDGEDKLVSIGFRVLARFLKMQPKVVKRCLRSLAEKRSIAFDLQYNVSSQQAFTYRIYSFSKILRLREEAGLLWATRNRGGVIFVAKPVGYIEGDELRTSEGLEPSEPTEDTEGTDAPEGGPTQGTPSAGSMASPSEGSKPPRITDTNVRHYNQTDDQTRIPAGLAAVLIAVFGVVDDNYLQQLVKACRQVAPDVTDQELIDVMTVKAAEIANGKSNSPKAVLLRAAPVCFKGESFQQLRRIRATAISKPPSVDDDHWWAGLSPEGVQSRLAMYQELAANPKSLNHEFAKKQLAKFEGREGN